MGANTEVLRQGAFSASSCGVRFTLTEAREPTTATRSRCPLAFTLSTAQPFSSLKKVTRSISPERLSTGRDGCSVRNGGDCGCTVSDWQGRLVPATLRPCQSTNCASSTSLPAYGPFWRP